MKLMILSSRFPWPLDKGDKLRMYHQIRYLSKTNKIYLFSLTDCKVDQSSRRELLKYCEEVYVFPLTKPMIAVGLFRALFRNKPLQIGYFYNPSIAKEIESHILKIKPEHIYGQLVRVADYIASFSIDKSLDLQDALSTGLLRRADKERFFKKWLFNFEARRMLDYEATALSEFDGLSIITEADKNLLPLSIRSKVKVVPNGVDFNFFNAKVQEKKYELVFTGNMSYAPNVMAANFLANDIMPMVWKTIPNARLLIAGASPHASVKALQTPRVIVSGWLDDIREAYSSSRIFIAPMQIGTGLQNKLLEAMAMRLPCVSSDLANKALMALDGKEIVIAPKDSAPDYANAIIKLLQQEDYAEQIADNGYNFVKRNYDWESAVNLLEQMWQKTE